SSWASAFRSLQPALAAAVAGDEVRIAAGTYVPSEPPGPDPTHSFVLNDGVAIRGGYAGVGANPDARDFGLYQTVLSGDLLKNDALALVPGQPYPDPLFRTDNSHHVVTIPSTAGSTALLEGVTIRSGHADGTAVLDRRGG